MPDAAKWSIPNEVGGVFNTINFIAHTYAGRSTQITQRIQTNQQNQTKQRFLHKKDKHFLFSNPCSLRSIKKGKLELTQKHI